MKRSLIVGMAALASCAPAPKRGCPAIERLAHRDIVAEAQTALVKGDRHLLMLGGYVGTVPGAPEAAANPTQMMEGTEDTTTEECTRQRAKAETYAAKYNEIITRAD